MEINFIRIWLPCSLALHVLLLLALACLRIPPAAPPEPKMAFVITHVTVIPSGAPAPAPKPPGRVAHPRPLPHQGITAPAKVAPVTIQIKAQAQSNLGGLRHGQGGPRIPGPPASIQQGAPLAPGANGGPSARLAAPETGRLGAYGTPNGLHQDVPALPQAGPSMTTGDHGSWAAAPGAADGAGRAPVGAGKSGPGEMASLPEGGQMAYVTQGTGGPVASAPTATRAGTVMAGGANGSVHPGGGSGIERDVRGLPGGGAMTGTRGNWSERPGDADGTGRSPVGIVRAGPAAGGDDDAPVGAIIASGRTTGPGPGGYGGGAERAGTAGDGDRPGSGAGHGGIDRDVRGLPGGSGNSGTGRGTWADSAGSPGGSGYGGGDGAGHGGVSCSASCGDGGNGIAFQYPTLAAMEGLEGTVYVDTTLCANGTVKKKSSKVTKGTKYDSLDNAAIRAVEAIDLLSNRITPALKNGEPVDSRIHFKVVFTKGEARIYQVE